MAQASHRHPGAVRAQPAALPGVVALDPGTDVARRVSGARRATAGSALRAPRPDLAETDLSRAFADHVAAKRQEARRAAP